MDQMLRATRESEPNCIKDSCLTRRTEPAQFDQSRCSEDLQRAIAQAGLIGSVSARISGTVERLSANAYRLVADELILLE